MTSPGHAQNPSSLETPANIIFFFPLKDYLAQDSDMHTSCITKGT
jgi:hypothetical protein